MTLHTLLLFYNILISFYVKIYFYRYKAQQSKENKQINPDVSKSTFIQTFKQMYNKISWNSLCGTDKVFSVKYVGGFGEQGVDAGGK